MDNTKTWTKTIQNSTEMPWLDWIESGVKKYEGRVLRKDWSKMKCGDILILDSGKKTVKTIITSILHYSNFMDAYDALGTELVPINNCSRNDVAKIYEKVLEGDPTSMTDQLKYGVVAIGIKLI